MADPIKLPPLPNFRDWPYTHEELRARDLEVAKCALEAAAMACERPESWHLNWAASQAQQAIRALEFRHD